MTIVAINSSEFQNFFSARPWITIVRDVYFLSCMRRQEDYICCETFVNSYLFVLKQI